MRRGAQRASKAAFPLDVEWETRMVCELKRLLVNYSDVARKIRGSGNLSIGSKGRKGWGTADGGKTAMFFVGEGSVQLTHRWRLWGEGWSEVHELSAAATVEEDVGRRRGSAVRGHVNL